MATSVVQHVEPTTTLSEEHQEGSQVQIHEQTKDQHQEQVDLLAMAPYFGESIAERLKKRQRPVSYAPAASKQIAVKRFKATHTEPAQDTSGDLMDTTPIDAIPTPPRSDAGVSSPQPGDDNSRSFNSDMTDVEFADATLQALQQRAIYRQCVVLGQTQRIIQLLLIATPATQEEGPVLSPEQASSYLEPGTYHDGPIFLKDQQPMPLVTVNELCDEFYNDNAEVWIQDPHEVVINDSTREVPIGEVKARLRDTGPCDYPWNCLEMAAPFEDGTRPQFLNTAECRLLTKIKLPDPDSSYAAAKIGRKALYAGYKEAEKWVLLAQAGALTEPHQDSHGYSTYITVNEGIMGFGWMHMPTDVQRQRWLKNSTTFNQAQWRYRVLRPGDTVYFPAGTVHFVFRHPNAGHTLAFGGHVLRCSTIVQWIQTMKDEAAHRNVTNEDLTTGAAGYLETVGRFVQQALASDDPKQLARWGGKQSIETFLQLKGELLSQTKPRTKAVKAPRAVRKA